MNSSVIHDVAVVIPTTLSDVLGRSVRSVFNQDFPGTVQIMIGVDVALGSTEIIDELKMECPSRMQIVVLDLGYSTSARHGGIYKNWSGGALRTLLSYAANSRYLAYLDDDNWWSASHISDLMGVIDNHGWAFSLRWYVDPGTLEPICIDEWESVGPGKGMYKKKFNGFVDTNCLLLDKIRCHWELPAWCIPKNRKGAGVDRVLFERLQEKFSHACTGNATAYYVVREEDLPAIENLKKKKRRRKVQDSGATG